MPSLSTSGLVEVDVPLGARRVGRREDLLRRQVREVAQAVARREVGRPPGAASAAARPSARCPGPRSSIASKRRSVSAGSPSVERRHALVPGGGRVGLVEPQHVLELGPELLVGVVLVELRDRRAWPRRDAGTGRSTSSSLRSPTICADLLQPGQLVLAEQRRVEARRARPGRRRRRARCARRRARRAASDAVAVPRRDERRASPGRRSRSARASRSGSKYDDVDELARRAGRPPPRPRARAPPGRARADGDDLAGLDVRTVDGELGEGVSKRSSMRQAIVARRESMR